MDEPDEVGYLAGYPTNHPLTTAAGGSRVASTWTLMTAAQPAIRGSLGGRLGDGCFRGDPDRYESLDRPSQ
jgi:hypothetical protein